jgi:hypothetical protein
LKEIEKLMSHGKLREDQTCQNCGNKVEERYCGHCGQENTYTRQPFYFLFTHFFEDFTHYDGQFWRTIRYLLFVPGKLTNEYLAGRRQQFVAPVKLYIFISFIAFFIPTLFPDSAGREAEKKEAHSKALPEITPEERQMLLNIAKSKGLETDEKVQQLFFGYDSIYKTKLKKSDLFEDTATEMTFSSITVNSKNQYDSLAEHSGNASYRIMRPFIDKIFDLKEKGYSESEILEKFKETFIHALPKALFLYLPIFAFFMWLFHSKKKWWFFDHGIFTLHFFSFLLLSVFLITAVQEFSDWIHHGMVDMVANLFAFVAFIYMIRYFFKAHRRVYQTSKKVTVLNGTLLFFLNMVIMLFLLIGLALLSFLMLH